MNSGRVFLFGLLLFAAGVIASVPQELEAAAPPKELHAGVANAVAREAEAQKRYDAWSDQRAALSGEIRDLKATEAWLQFQTEKYEQYIKKQHSVIGELNRRKEEAKRIRMELEPFLETVVDSLEEFTEQDLPFLQEERQRRFAFLHSSLDDYHLDLSEKLRRVFEALQVEVEYGRNISTEPDMLELHGVPVRVSVFRLGRTALYYTTLDGSEAGVWDREQQAWVPVDADVARTLHRAGEMAERKKAVELLVLPVGRNQ